MPYLCSVSTKWGSVLNSLVLIIIEVRHSVFSLRARGGLIWFGIIKRLPQLKTLGIVCIDGEDTKKNAFAKNGLTNLITVLPMPPNSHSVVMGPLSVTTNFQISRQVLSFCLTSHPLPLPGLNSPSTRRT